MKDTFTEGLEEVMDNLHKGGAFLTAGDDKKCNTMTISWGSVGYMWANVYGISKNLKIYK